MRSRVTRLPALALFVLLILLATSLGCTETVDETATTVDLTPGLEVPAEVVGARRAVLDFLRVNANECVPPAGVPWKASLGQAPEGFGVYRFSAEGCVITVSYPLATGEETLYHVTLRDSVSGLCWQANVNSRGSVVDTGVFAEMLPELANAAAAYCTEQGYEYEIRTQANGIQCGVCLFPDGSACNAWAFFQGECRSGDISAEEY